MLVKGNPYAYNTDFYLNNELALSVKNSSFNLNLTQLGTPYLYKGPSNYVFNYLSSLNTTLFNSSTPSNNNFYLRFNASQYNDMPWFSILANYTTTLSVPQGVTFNQSNFYNIAGVGIPAKVYYII